MTAPQKCIRVYKTCIPPASAQRAVRTNGNGTYGETTASLIPNLFNEHYSDHSLRRIAEAQKTPSETYAVVYIDLGNVMSSLASATRRLNQTKDMLFGKAQDPATIPWNPNNTSFPLRKDCVGQPGQPEGACWVWGKDDYCGRLNLLTPTRVKAAAAEIRTGETAPLDLPSNVPAVPGFGRQDFKHKIKALTPGKSYDDFYEMNTQSGTQWDGFRHVAHQATGIFYNNTNASDFTNGNEQNTQCSIHHWRDNGFSGRGVLLDYKAYAEHSGIKYDTATSHEISYDALVNIGKHQGLDIRPTSQGGDIQPGDILLIRTGWTVDYYSRTADENKTIAQRSEQNWVGVKPSLEMIDWLHDSYFSAVGGDAPAFERWPPLQKSSTPGTPCLHEYLLALWGVPIGEMLDLEKVSELAKKNNRWTFFFSSAPFRTIGGVASWVNGTAIF